MNPFQRFINYIKSKFNRTPQIEAPNYNAGRLEKIEPVNDKKEEGNIVEDSNTPKKFKEGLVESAKNYDWENMPRDEAITTMLKNLGMKPELANNEDAKKEILEIVNNTIGNETKISDSTQGWLKGLIGDDGTIAFDEDLLLNGKSGRFYEVVKGNREVLSSVCSTIIDVNEEGQLVKHTITNLSDKSTFYDGRIDENYSSTDITAVIDGGIEMNRIEIYTDTTKSYPSKSTHSSTKTITLTRDRKLPTRAYGSVNIKGDNILANGNVSLYNVNAYDAILGKYTNLANLSLDDIRNNENLPGFGYYGPNQEEMKRQEGIYNTDLKQLIDEDPKFKRLANKLGIVNSIEDVEPDNN